VRSVRASALLLAGFLALVAPASARRPRCPDDCQPCYLDGCGNVGDCLDQAEEARGNCVDNVLAFPGKCKLTSDRIRDCDATAFGLRHDCFATLRRKIQADCHDAGEACRITARGARRACNACGVSARAASRGTSLVPQASADDPGGCQSACIRNVVQGCYDDCRDACAGEDPRALPKCQQACKNAQCETLQNRCTDSGDDAGKYHSCCVVFGGCLDDVNCETTTTTTRVTTTSTSSTSTTTVVGASTTTSTTM